MLMLTPPDWVALLVFWVPVTFFLAVLGWDIWKSFKDPDR